MKFIAKYIDKSSGEIKNILQYEISFSFSIPCNSLRLYFLCDDTVLEMTEISVYNGNRLIFFGFIDKQTTSCSKNGTKHFIYARSSASLLVDNEASPITYESPCVSGLFYINCAPYGFENLLKDYSCSETYEISKGTSAFSVIQNFVSIFSDDVIFVSPENQLKVFEKSNSAKVIDKSTVIEKKTIINRGNPISTVDYKINSSENYNHHMRSVYLENNGINTKRNMNLTGTSQWQRNHKAKAKIKSSLEDYYGLLLTLTDDNYLSLYDKVDLKNIGFLDFRYAFVDEITYLSDGGGKRCEISLKPEMNLEVINYVDK